MGVSLISVSFAFTAMLAEWRASEDSDRSGGPAGKDTEAKPLLWSSHTYGDGWWGKEGEEEVPSQAEFFPGIILSLVSPDTILKKK